MTTKNILYISEKINDASITQIFAKMDLFSAHSCSYEPKDLLTNEIKQNALALLNQKLQEEYGGASFEQLMFEDKKNLLAQVTFAVYPKERLYPSAPNISLEFSEEGSQKNFLYTIKITKITEMEDDALDLIWTVQCFRDEITARYDREGGMFFFQFQSHWRQKRPEGSKCGAGSAQPTSSRHQQGYRFWRTYRPSVCA